MPKFQVVSVKPLSGRSDSGRDWSMMIYSGVLTNDDGSMEVGEVSMMLRDGQAAPQVKPGESYTPIFGARAQKGKLVVSVIDFRPLAQVAPVGRAAAGVSA